MQCLKYRKMLVTFPTRELLSLHSKIETTQSMMINIVRCILYECVQCVFFLLQLNESSSNSRTSHFYHSRTNILCVFRCFFFLLSVNSIWNLCRMMWMDFNVWEHKDDERELDSSKHKQIHYYHTDHIIYAIAFLCN